MNPRQALSEAHRLLIAAIKQGGNDPQALQRALKLIEMAMPDAGVNVATRPGRKETRIQYMVTRDNGGERLSEIRTSGASQPFRCPQWLYDDLIDVLKGSERALSVEEMIEAVTVKSGRRPADFQIRVPLRLWVHVEPPLVLRTRARYAPADKHFATHARKLWDTLRG